MVILSIDFVFGVVFKFEEFLAEVLSKKKHGKIVIMVFALRASTGGGKTDTSSDSSSPLSFKVDEAAVNHRASMAVTWTEVVGLKSDFNQLP